MNFETINTPADLEKANSEVTPMEKVREGLKELGADETLKLATIIVDNLAEYHHFVATKLIEDGDKEAAAAWVYDESALKSALMILNTIEI